MFGVLVVILCPDRVADLSFSTGKRQITFIISLRVLGALRLGASGTRCPPLRVCSKRRCRSGWARTHDCFWAILHSSLLGGCRQMRRGNDHNFCRLNVAYNTKAGDSYCSLSPACPFISYIGKHLVSPKSCLKDGDVPKPPCSCNWQPSCPSTGTLSNIELVRIAGAIGIRIVHIRAPVARAPWPSGPLTARSKRNTACRFSSATTMSTKPSGCAPNCFSHSPKSVSFVSAVG
jgi:hypothetical protein